jgi:hypothetical protein
MFSLRYVPDDISRRVRVLIRSLLVSSQLEDCRGTVIISLCCEKPIAEAGDTSGTQRNGNVRRWQPLPTNGSEDVTMDTSVCVVVNCKL